MEQTPNAGGAAMGAGSNFQQRVCAWLLLAMHRSLPISTILSITSNETITALSFQPGAIVDDAVARTVTAGIFFQVKRSISLSSKPDSEFQSVISQFIGQYLCGKDNPEVYFLVVSPRASGRIREELRKLLTLVRMDATGWRNNPLSQAEQETLQTLEGAISMALVNRGQSTYNDEALRQFLSRIYVLTLDLEEGGADERSALLLLTVAPRIAVAPELAWSHLVAMCLSAAGRRLTIDRAYVDNLLSSYYRPAGHSDNEDAAPFQVADELSCGWDWILGRSEATDNDFAIWHLLRFNEDGTERTRFNNNIATLKNGITIAVSARASSMAGIARFVESNSLDITQDALPLFSAGSDVDANADPHAKARSEALVSGFRARKDNLTCIQCGSPLDEARAEFIENDVDWSPPQVGFVHAKCHLPYHRILGAAQLPFFDMHPELTGFDAALWIGALKRGGAFARGVALPENATLLWNPDGGDQSRFPFCIRMDLEDGSREYVTRRWKVHRFSAAGAREALHIMENGLAAARAAGDPVSVTRDSKAFGTYSRLISIYRDDMPLRVERFSVEPYTAKIGSLFTTAESYYAPLLQIRIGADDEPFCLGPLMVFVSDPLRVGLSLKNWAAAGISFQNHRIDILEDDAAFDKTMLDLLRRDMRAIIDPMLDLSGQIISGILIDIHPDAYIETQ